MANIETVLTDVSAVGGWSTAALLARQRMQDRRNQADQSKRK